MRHDETRRLSTESYDGPNVEKRHPLANLLIQSAQIPRSQFSGVSAFALSDLCQVSSSSTSVLHVAKVYHAAEHVRLPEL